MYEQRPLKVKVSITIDNDVEEEIKKYAELDDRPFSQYINRVLRQHIEKRKESEQPKAAESKAERNPRPLKVARVCIAKSSSEKAGEEKNSKK